MSPTAWQRVVSAMSTAATAYGLATETVATTVQVSDVAADSVVHLLGFLIFATGVGATNSTPRLHRGGLTGPVVGVTASPPTVASSTIQLFTVGDDQPGDVASQTYTLSLTANGAGATGILAYLMAVVG